MKLNVFFVVYLLLVGGALAAENQAFNYSLVKKWEGNVDANDRVMKVDVYESQDKTSRPSIILSAKNGKYILGTKDGSARKSKQTVKGFVNEMTLSGNFLSTEGGDEGVPGKLMLRDSNNLLIKDISKQLGNYVSFSFFSKDGKRIFVGDEQGLKMFDGSGNLVNEMDGSTIGGNYSFSLDHKWTAPLGLDSCHSKKRIGFPAISVSGFEAA
jgi:hypothetical protein